MKYRHNKSRAFTLVEILTTVAIIGILLAVLIPALNQVGKKALVVKQKAQFHAIELAMEAFRSDVGDYPPSVYDNSGNFAGYTAPHRLAEAIVGRDGLGFHQGSIYRNDGRNASGGELYYPDYESYLSTLAPADREAARQANLAARKGPYLELESANAVRLGDIFPNMDPILVNSYVLADSFRTTKNSLTGRKTGMPILYYRANRTKIAHPTIPPYDDSALNASVYDVRDSNVFLPSLNIVQIEAAWFYQKTWNRNFQNPARPYRAESFILHSAGPDGLFGTADDVFNFDEEN